MKDQVIQPFYLPTADGDCFAVFYPSIGRNSSQPTASKTVVVCPPFAEEVNKSRRMISQLGRCLAANNINMLSIDLHGTGESDGDFSEVNIDIWISNLRKACEWLLVNDSGAQISLLGVRAGSLLAGLLASEKENMFNQLVLWQPVRDGEKFIKQFLRVKAMSEMISEGKASNTASQLFDNLINGDFLDVAGYSLSSRLTKDIVELDLYDLLLPILNTSTAISIFEVSTTPETELSRKTTRFIEKLTADGGEIPAKSVCGPNFWNSLEIMESQLLIDETVRVLSGGFNE